MTTEYQAQQLVEAINNLRLSMEQCTERVLLAINNLQISITEDIQALQNDVRNN